MEILAHFSRTHHGDEDGPCGDMDRANTCTVELKKPDSRGQTVCLKKKTKTIKYKNRQNKSEELAIRTVLPLGAGGQGGTGTA